MRVFLGHFFLVCLSVRVQWLRVLLILGENLQLSQEALLPSLDVSGANRRQQVL